MAWQRGGGRRARWCVGWVLAGAALGWAWGALSGCRHTKGPDERARLPQKVPVAIASNATESTAAGDAGAATASGGERAWTGNAEPNRRSTIMPRIPGIIARVHVREGDVVHAGDVLVELDASDLELQEAQARAGVDQARVQVNTARIEYERAKKLFESKAIPKRQLDLAHAQLQGARAGLKQAEAALARAHKAVRDAVIRAPYDGVVVMRHKNEGEYAAAMPPTPLVTIDELDPLLVKVSVPSRDLAWLERGAKVRVEFDALHRSVEARVERIVPAINPVARTATAIVEVPNPDYALPSGLFARVVPLGKPATQPGAAGVRSPPKGDAAARAGTAATKGPQRGVEASP